MRWTRGGLLVSCALAMLVLAACGAGGPSEAELANQAEWTWIQETKKQLDAKRQELADLKSEVAAMAAEPEAGEAEGEVEGEAVPEGEADPAARLEAVSAEVAALSDEFGQRLVNFINQSPMEEGVEPTEQQKELLRLKSGEDIVLAKEWIEQGGDYKRAIEIYNTALMFDPENEDLKQALAEAEASRYMSPERFGQAKKGMTEDEIRAALGTPLHYNVRDFPERNVKAWFYPTAEDGSAAAVWFEPDKKTGELKSYKLDYEGIKPQQEESAA